MITSTPILRSPCHPAGQIRDRGIGGEGKKQTRLKIYLHIITDSSSTIVTKSIQVFSKQDTIFLDVLYVDHGFEWKNYRKSILNHLINHQDLFS